MDAINNRDKILADWRAASTELRAVRHRELELRNQVIDAFSTETNEMASGIENIDLGWGYELKISHKLNYKLDKPEAVEKALDAIEKSEEGGYVIAERLVGWKPEISVAEYHKLSDEHKAIIDQVLTIQPATKSVELKEKGKK